MNGKNIRNCKGTEEFEANLPYWHSPLENQDSFKDFQSGFLALLPRFKPDTS
jgi:hypothetical protein